MINQGINRNFKINANIAIEGVARHVREFYVNSLLQIAILYFFVQLLAYAAQTSKVAALKWFVYSMDLLFHVLKFQCPKTGNIV